MKVQFKLLLLALALVLVCCFALVACDSGDEPAPASSSSSTGGSSTGGSSTGGSSAGGDTVHEVHYAYKDADGNDVIVQTASVRHGRKITSVPSKTALQNRPLMEGKAFVEWIIPDGASEIIGIQVLEEMTIYFEVRDLEVFTVSIGIPAKYADFYAPKYPDATKDDDGNLIIDSHEVYEGETFNAKNGLPKNLMIDEHTYYDETAGEWCGFYFNYAWTNQEALSGINSDVLILADINDVEGVVPYVENAPTIDGERDAAYGTQTYKLIKSYISGELANVNTDYDWQYLDATMSLCWSGEYIYVFVEVKDPSMNSNYDAAYLNYVTTNDNPFRNDAVELWYSFGQLRPGVEYDEETNRYTVGATVCENAGQYIFSKNCIDALATKLYCGVYPSTYFPATRSDDTLRAAKRKLDGEEGGSGTYSVEFVIRARLDATEEQKTEDNLDPVNKDLLNPVYLGDKLNAGHLVFFGLQINDVKAIANLGNDSNGNPIEPHLATNDYIAFGTQSQGDGAGAYKAVVRNEKYAIVPGTAVGALEGDGCQVRRMVLGGAAPAAN